MKQSTMYCHKRESTYNKKTVGSDFWYNDCDLHPKTTELYEEGIPVYKLLVKELQSGERSSYWAWWDNRKERFTMMYYHKDLLEMCFPYGFKPETEAGKGKEYNVMIEDLGIVEKEKMESI